MKKILALLISVALLFSMVVVPVSAEDDVTYISEKKNVLFADVNEKLEFSDIFVKVKKYVINAENFTFSCADDAVTVDADGITASEKGTFAIDMSSDDLSFTVYLFVKEASEDQFVIYEENFDGYADGNLPEELGYTLVFNENPETVQIDGGKLMLNGLGGTAGVILPQYLNVFTDYDITVDFGIAMANEGTRWASLMYRYQGIETYYQMAIRQNATASNGVEFAKRANGWNVVSTYSYEEKMDPEKMYELNISVMQAFVIQTINGEESNIATNLTEYVNGNIGMQANGSLAYYDNIRVVVSDAIVDSLDDVVFSPVAEVYEPESNIVLAPTTIKNIRNMDDIKALEKDETPASAFFRVDAEMNVLDESGAVICPMAGIDGFVGYVIPIFCVTDEASCYAAVDFINERGLFDSFIASTDHALLQQMRLEYQEVGSIYIAQPEGEGDLDEATLLDIRAKSNTAMSKIVFLDAKFATKDNVDFLQKLATSVWFVTENPTDVEAYTIITSGANGIMTNDIEQLFRLYKTFDERTFVRKSFIIGHRGMPSRAPENSIEGTILAVESGATHVESDIYITTDGYVVIMHDGNTSRTADRNLPIEGSTLEQLKELNLKSSFSEYQNLKIPELREYLTALKETNGIAVIEIKSGRTAVIDATVEFLRELEMEDQAVFISFNSNQLKYLAMTYPEMSGGFLCTATGEQTVGSTVLSLIKSLRPMNATHNTSYGGLGPNLLSALRHRGITSWPWTVNTAADFYKLIAIGATAVTTDHAYWGGSIVYDLSAPLAYSFDAAQGGQLVVTETTYDNLVEDVAADEYIVLDDGGTGVTVSAEGVVSATAAGTASIMAKKAYILGDGTPYTLYTQPIAVTFTASEAPATTPTQTPAEDTPTEAPDATPTEMPAEDTPTEAPSDSEGGSDMGGIIIAVIAAAVIVAAVVVVLVVKSKKK